MKAELLTRFRTVTDDGMIQMTVWKVLEPVPPSTHLYKYSLVFIVDGHRVIGYDNERGKGDHGHENGAERPYEFAGIERLIEDFIADVAHWRN